MLMIQSILYFSPAVLYSLDLFTLILAILTLSAIETQKPIFSIFTYMHIFEYTLYSNTIAQHMFKSMYKYCYIYVCVYVYTLILYYSICISAAVCIVCLTWMQLHHTVPYHTHFWRFCRLYLNCGCICICTILLVAVKRETGFEKLIVVFPVWFELNWMQHQKQQTTEWKNTKTPKYLKTYFVIMYAILNENCTNCFSSHLVCFHNSWLALIPYQKIAKNQEMEDK